MIPIPQGDPEVALKRWMAAWFDLLGAGRLSDACAQLDPSPTSGRRWTPEALLASIQNEFGPGTRFAVDHPDGPTFTPASTARGSSNASVIPYADGTGYSGHHGVPLNGAFSDLSAQFDFHRAGSQLHVVLYDLHVL